MAGTVMPKRLDTEIGIVNFVSILDPALVA